MKIITNISNKATRLVSKAKFKVKKVSPELLIIGGVGCVIGATVLACRATKKAETVMDDCEDDIRAIRDEATTYSHDDEGNEIETVVLTKEDKHNILMTKVHAIGNLARVYAPSVALGTAGIAMIFTSHGIMKKRNGALLASYNALDAAFRSYRERVLAEEDGRERDRRYLTGERARIESGPVELTEGEIDAVMNPDDVAEVNRKAMREAHSAAMGPYSFIFDSYTTRFWSAYALNNLNTIRSAEQWATSELRINGHLFLNDVLDRLGMDKVSWGQLVGWIRGDEEGDQYVEIIARDQADAIQCDLDHACGPIYLDFNCQGLIWTKI